jgi:hypothetical protein
MKFNSRKEAFIIGLVASLSAVIIWDLVKHKYKILNYGKENE